MRTSNPTAWLVLGGIAALCFFCGILKLGLAAIVAMLGLASFFAAERLLAKIDGREGGAT
jgi:hypothetical protein